jgi:hypothetical protein
MFRGILAVLVGVLVTAAVMAMGLTGAYLALGTDKVFQPGSFEVSGLMTMIMFAALALAVVAGGAVCSKVAKGEAGPCRVLAGLLLVLMLAGAGASYMAGPPARRNGGSQGLEAMSRAHTPPLASIVNALVCGSGALAGGFVARHRK